MKGFWHSIFMPTSNRYYVGKRRAAKIHALLALPFILFVGISSIVFASWPLALLSVLIIIFIVLDYMIIDRLIDKGLWHFIFKKYYGHDLRTTNEHQAMKNYKSNPSDENYHELQRSLKKP